MIKAILSFFSAADSDNPKTVRAWRLTVSTAISLFVFFVVWAFGAFTKIGIDGFAFADEIDTKITIALQPVNKQLGVQDGYLKRLVKRGIRVDIHEKCQEWCDETDQRKRQRIRGDLEDLQEQYETITAAPGIPGKRYPEPDCDNS